MGKIWRCPVANLDYNDDEFVFTGASIVSTPEPASLALISIGILGVFSLKRRRLCQNRKLDLKGEEDF